jgi:sulfate adenylyltransferase
MVKAMAPHGGTLVNRWLWGDERHAAIERANRLVRVRLDSREASDLEMMGDGALSPLVGFMNRDDYTAVVQEMRLSGGLLWALPVTLATTSEQAASVPLGGEVALEGPDGQLLGLMRVTDIFPCARETEANRCYGTAELAHPGVRRLMQQGDLYLGGEVWLVNRARPQFPAYHLTPAETRAAFAEKGWRTVVGFQTRNPVHRAHEYIQKCALEICDGLLLHPLVGETKSDDLPAEIRMKAYEAILSHYYPAGRTILSVFPAAMRYAGPREAVWHAICRKNYGCTHFVVGRDHAGVGTYYGAYDAQRIFDEIDPAELGIAPLFFEHAFFCRACGNMASPKTCPHGPGSHVTLSGTRVRELLASGQVPPVEFSRPEVAQVLINGLRDRVSSH